MTKDPELATSGRDNGGAGRPLVAATAPMDNSEKAREAAYYSEHEWKGIPLIGLTSGRWGLILQQRAVVTDIPFIEALGGDAWFSDAMRILYFCATTEADWRPFRRDSMAWQEEIERWGNENAPVYERLAIESLAFKIYEEANVNRHEVAPPEKGATTPGN